jgi:hypothetical protein
MRRAPPAVALLLLACYPNTSELTKTTGTGGASGAGAAGGASGAGATGGTAGSGGRGGSGPGGTGGSGPGGTGGSGTGGSGGSGTGGGGAGGGGAGGTGGAPPPDAGPPAQTRAQACAQYGQSTAAKAMQCAPFVVSLLYGNMANYAGREELNCNLHEAPGVNFPPRPFRPCSDAYAAISCDDWRDGVIPAACIAFGQYAEGVSCSTGFQCATDLCDLTGGGSCGRCVRPPAVGQACLAGQFCAAGLRCSLSQLCATPVGRGGSCSGSNPCRSSLVCNDIATCAPRGQAGAACQTADDCEVVASTYCNTTRGLCVSATTGGACRMNTDGSLLFCGFGAACQGDGSCLAAASDSGLCASGGPLCVFPAACGTDGRCHLPTLDKTCGPAATRPDPRLPPGDRASGVRSLFSAPLRRALPR